MEFADQQRRLKEMRQNPPHQSGRNFKAAESEKFGARTPRMQKEFQELRAYGDNVAMQLQGGWKGPLAPGQHLPKDGLDAMHMIMSKAASLSDNSRDFSLLLKATFAPNNQLGVLPYGVPKSKLMGPDDLQAVALPSTGFHNDWKDTTRGTTSDLDQSHHLTAFVLTGYIYGDSAGAVGVSPTRQSKDAWTIPATSTWAWWAVAMDSACTNATILNNYKNGPINCAKTCANQPRVW